MKEKKKQLQTLDFSFSSFVSKRYSWNVRTIDESSDDVDKKTHVHTLIHMLERVERVERRKRERSREENNNYNFLLRSCNCACALNHVTVLTD